MERHGFITPAVVRLVREGIALPGRRYYRPLVVGPAIMARGHDPREPWVVELARDEGLVPRGPRSPLVLERTLAGLRRQGLTCRVALALACPHDAAAPRSLRRPTPVTAHVRRSAEFYGWALLYQPPGMRGRAVVDADERFAELPLCFELPLELLDRAAHLEAHGIRTRPLAVVTRPEDFAVGSDGRRRNRFFPEAAFRSLHEPDAFTP
jgi:hypothetical protein